MPDNLIRCHPLVGSSYLTVGREESEFNDNCNVQNSNAICTVSIDHNEVRNDIFQAPEDEAIDEFIIDDNGDPGHASIVAKRSHTSHLK